MKSSTRVHGIILMAVLLFLVSCSSPTSESPVSPLPTPATQTSPTSSEPTSLTPQSPATVVEGLPFSFDEPLTAGDTEVSGTGPIGVPIVIEDLTYVGEILGRGTIDTSGKFNIQIGTPLVVNHRIGILLDAESTEFEFTQEVLDQLEAFKAEEAIFLPRIGIAYDAASVAP